MVLHSTRWLALSYFTYFFSYGIFLPFWSVWLAGNGLTPETIGILLGAGLVARFLGSLLIAPRVSDPSRLIAALRVLALLTLLFALAFRWINRLTYVRNPKSRQDIPGHLLDSDGNIHLCSAISALMEGTNGREPTVPFEVFDDYTQFHETGYDFVTMAQSPPGIP